MPSCVVISSCCPAHAAAAVFRAPPPSLATTAQPENTVLSAFKSFSIAFRRVVSAGALTSPPFLPSFTVTRSAAYSTSSTFSAAIRNAETSCPSMIPIRHTAPAAGFVYIAPSPSATSRYSRSSAVPLAVIVLASQSTETHSAYRICACRAFCAFRSRVAASLSSSSIVTILYCPALQPAGYRRRR